MATVTNSLEVWPSAEMVAEKPECWVRALGHLIKRKGALRLQLASWERRSALPRKKDP